MTVHSQAARTMQAEVQPQKFLTGTDTNLMMTTTLRPEHGAGQPIMSLDGIRFNCLDIEPMSIPGSTAKASLGPSPCPSTRDVSFNVFVQWGLASRRRHEQHTYLTRFAKAAPLAATVTKLKRETIPEFLSQRKLWRLLFAGLGKTTVGTALTLQDDVCPALGQAACRRLTVV